ncbi:MAG: tetratricopeptide repeat protein [Bryobacterales bacterium]|nr:tetratricopeptide repeat protein [Bryobacterales bacterium]MDE0261949.1 tetratricopeptide repeat protein [Bryobacterales bacterium]
MLSSHYDEVKDSPDGPRTLPRAGRAESADGESMHLAGWAAAVLLTACPCASLLAQEPPRPASLGSSSQLRQQKLDARRLLDADPSNASAWSALGQARLGLNEHDLAVEAFERAVAIGLQDPSPYLNLGLLYASRGQLESALEAFELGLERDPSNRSARFNHARVLLGLGRAREAVLELERLTAVAPEDWEAAVALVDARLLAGQRDSALGDALELAATAPDAPALVSLGKILTREGELAPAADILEQALAMSGDDMAVWIELSRLRQKEGDSERAVRAAERAVQLAPGKPEAILGYAEALISSRRHQRALEFLTGVSQRMDHRPGFHHTLGVAYFGLHRFIEAAAAFGRATELDPAWDTPYFLLGTSRLASGDSLGAAEAYRQAIAANPHNPLPFVYLVRAYDRLGPDFDALGVEAARRALELDPQNVECSIRLARHVLEQGRLQEARAALEGIVRSHPDILKSRILLARTYNRLGMPEEAAAQRDAVNALNIQQDARDATRGEDGGSDRTPSPGLGLGAWDER